MRRGCEKRREGEGEKETDRLRRGEEKEEKKRKNDCVGTRVREKKRLSC